MLCFFDEKEKRNKAGYMLKCVSQYLNKIQEGLFPGFAEEMGPMSDRHAQLMVILDVVRVEEFVTVDPYPLSAGRPPSDRSTLVRAFIAKSVLNIPTTVALIDRLKVDRVLRRICGWEAGRKIPCEATFSNAFLEFSQSKLPEKVHGDLVKDALKDEIVFHISRDSTAIESREKIKYSNENVSIFTEKKRGRGRPLKGEILPPKTPTRLEQQQTKSLQEMLAELPKDATKGVKRNAQGFQESWKGFKLHIDTADGGIPISCILTSASMHDSGASLPLEAMTHTRVVSLYTLMDAAYDAPIIRNDVEKKGKVAIIDSNPRRGEKIEFTPPEKERYKVRSTAERANARIKDDFGGRYVRVKGASKVMCHLMFGVIALTAEQLVRVFY
jgi:hypothetical protein